MSIQYAFLIELVSPAKPAVALSLAIRLPHSPSQVQWQPSITGRRGI
jgi:hypothetical protein